MTRWGFRFHTKDTRHFTNVLQWDKTDRGYEAWYNGKHGGIYDDWRKADTYLDINECMRIFAYIESIGCYSVAEIVEP